MDELPELLLPDAGAWRDWLAEHHATSPGVWLVVSRKGGTVTSLDYEQAVRHGLCFGWIDGQKRGRDAESSRQRFTPRRPRSRWSQSNVQRVAELEAAGLMMPAGLAQVDAAKADGRWEAAYAGPAKIEVPEDLAAAIAADPAAEAAFDELSSANRFALIYRVTGMRRPQSRARKIAEFVAMLARGETIHPQ